MARIQENRKVMLAPLVDTIDPHTLAYMPGGYDTFQVIDWVEFIFLLTRNPICQMLMLWTWDRLLKLVLLKLKTGGDVGYEIHRHFRSLFKS